MSAWKTHTIIRISACILLLAVQALTANAQQQKVPTGTLPYKKAGLTDKQAAAILLSRFTYGARPGQVDEVARMGVDKWLEQQLNTGLPDEALNNRLSGYGALKLSNQQVLQQYPQDFVITHMAVTDGALSKDSLGGRAVNKRAYLDQLHGYIKQKGLGTDRTLDTQFISAKVLRAVYSNNQLQEVMTDFWFNHFNVFLGKNDCAPFIPAYERDVIRPRVLGRFDSLLVATAKSPAMLYYLDNFISMAKPAAVAEKPKPAAGTLTMGMTETPTIAGANDTNGTMQLKGATANRKVPLGLNENYAREVMELHTLGVDGGYTQNDVTEAARVLTGWTVYPLSDYGPGSTMKNVIARINSRSTLPVGYVREGDFIFLPERHDKGEKIVLGHHFPAGGGYTEGLTLLEMLANQNATANFICRKLAIRFVSDNPPQSLVDKMVKTYKEQDGDTKAILVTMASSPEFWAADAQYSKIKTPFELAVSTVRSLDADVANPYTIFDCASNMGEKRYWYQAPTGFPDRGQYWVNPGMLLNRINFGLALAGGQLPGINPNLRSLSSNGGAANANAALAICTKAMLPERNTAQATTALTPLLNIAGSNGDKDAMVQQTVGVIIGSPEFQKR